MVWIILLLQLFFSPQFLLFSLSFLKLGLLVWLKCASNT